MTDSALESQLRESYGRVAYTHKVHEKDADRYFARGRHLKSIQIILSAVTTGGLVAVVFGDSAVAAVVSTITSTLQLILTSYSKELNLGELAQKHSEAASKLWLFREQYVSLLADLRGGLSADDARLRRDEIQSELGALYAATPRTSSTAYKQAQAALQVNQELTFSDDEIDRLLPSALRTGA